MFHWKRGRCNMKLRKMFFVFLVILLVLPSLFVTADSNQDIAEEGEAQAQEDGNYSFKDEVIYATLDASGTQKEIYVVNHFNVTEPGNLTDYGNYTSVKNLTDLSEIEQDGNEIHFTATDENFYYQGNMNGAELPWNIAISYYLEGTEVKPQELLGQDGHVEIEIDISQNESGEALFFENYLMQISLMVDPERYRNIEAEEATEASAGKDKQFTFTVMPEEETMVRMSADVTDFELGAIDINAVPSDMSIDEPDTGEMTEEMGTLTDAIGEINDGVGELKDGISELNSGVADLEDGSAQYRAGMNEIDQASSELVEGSSEINDALTTISSSLSAEDAEFDLGELTQLPKGLEQMADSVGEAADGLEALRDGYEEAYGALDGAIEVIPENISPEDIAELTKSDVDPEVVAKFIETYEAALMAKGTYDEVKEGFQAITPALTNTIEGIRELETGLNTTASEISTAIENMDGMDPLTQLSEGLTELSSNYNTFHAGLVSYTEGVGELSDSYGELHGGIVELDEGTSELENGTAELHDGTEELYKSTNDLPDQMQEEIDKMISEYDNSDFDPVSFTSAENENVNSVQFVLRTESITVAEEDDDVTEDEKDKGIWERFLDLFR